MVLLRFIADIDDLENVVIRMEFQSSDVYLTVIPQKILSKSFHFLRPSGAPHEHLSVGLKTIHTQIIIDMPILRHFQSRTAKFLFNLKFETLVVPLDEVVTIAFHKYSVIMPRFYMASSDSRDALTRC